LRFKIFPLNMDVMKKLPAFILLMAFMVMNIASTAHADCAEGFICDGMQQVESIDQHDQNDDNQQSNCDCCTTCSGHHHHSHMAFINSKADPLIAANSKMHAQTGETYLSQLHYPPSKPPKA
jgi:hypothetical protein